jgi:diphthamide synthase (EF-2-diphthine--ammonia ligase)
MTMRSVLALFLAVVVAVSAIELSTWILGRVVSAIVPSASVSEVNAEVPHAPEIDTPAPTPTPALTW